MPDLVTYLIQIPIFEWYMVRCGSTNGYKKRQVFKRHWTMCSRYDNYSRFNSQHNLRGLYDYLMSTRIFTLKMNKIFI